MIQLNNRGRAGREHLRASVVTTRNKRRRDRRSIMPTCRWPLWQYHIAAAVAASEPERRGEKYGPASLID
jgi:hypothetical protein